MRSSFHQGRRHGDQSGFTLVELVIVIVILGILAGIAVVAVGGLTSQSVQAACKADYTTIQVAVESYKAQEGIYPTNGLHGDTSATDAVAALLIQSTDTPPLGPWLKTQPTNGTHYRIEVADATGFVQVWKYDGTVKIPSTGTQTIADCAKTS